MKSNSLSPLSAHVAGVVTSVLVTLFVVMWVSKHQDRRSFEIPKLSDDYIDGTAAEAERDVWRKIIELELEASTLRSNDSAYIAAPVLAICYSQLGRIADARGDSETATVFFDKAILYAEKGGIADDLRRSFLTNQEICCFLADSTDKILNPRWRRELGLSGFVDLPPE